VAMVFGWFWLGIDFFALLPLRIWGIMTNFTLAAVPLFILMGYCPVIYRAISWPQAAFVTT